MVSVIGVGPQGCVVGKEIAINHHSRARDDENSVYNEWFQLNFRNNTRGHLIYQVHPLLFSLQNKLCGMI